MKKIIISSLMLLAFTLSASAQEIFNEVNAIMEKQKTIKFDKKYSMQERKIATFKYDAIYYLIYKGAETEGYTEQQLGEQVSAMIDFVDLFLLQLGKESKKSKREVVLALFKKLSVENALFKDLDKELVWGYVDNSNFLTQFSLDTNWVEALAQAQKIYK